MSFRLFRYQSYRTTKVNTRLRGSFDWVNCNSLARLNEVCSTSSSVQQVWYIDAMPIFSLTQDKNQHTRRRQWSLNATLVL